MADRFALTSQACRGGKERRARVCLGIGVLLLSTAGITRAGIDVWTSNGPEGGSIWALAIDPDTPTTLYAGTDRGGVFKSTNRGTSWSAVNTGLTSTCAALAIDPTTPTTLYAGGGGNVFKSTDGGNNWSGTECGSAGELAIDPATPTTLYAGGAGGVFKSTNGGINWSAVNTGLTYSWVSPLAIDPATPTTLYAGTFDGVFKSTNGGGNWSTVNSGLDVLALAIDPVSPTTLYAGTLGGVFKSTNGGGNWSAVNTGLTYSWVRALAIDPTAPTTLYAGTTGGVFKSTKGGNDWSAVNTGLTNTNVTALAIDPATPTTLYAGTFAGGVFAIELLGPCTGDCSGENIVTVDELLTMVNIALGKAAATACEAGDVNDDGRITVDEIVAAVNNALNGCPPPVATATPTPTPTTTSIPTPTVAVGQVLFREGWERAAIRRYAPDSQISGDSGTWLVGDTVSNFPECGPSPHFAEVVLDQGSRRLRLVSNFSNSDCADNIAAARPNLDIPVTDDLYLMFSETGQLSGSRSCDAVFVHIEFDNSQRLSYVLQQGGGWGSAQRGWGCGSLLLTPHPFVLDASTRTQVRNVVADAQAAGLLRPSRVTFVNLEINEHGQATFDDIVLFRGAP